MMIDFESVRFYLAVSRALRTKSGKYDEIRLLWLNQAAAELRFNPYHDPTNGRFTTGNKFGVDFSGKGGIIEIGSDITTMNSVVEKEQEYGVPYGQDAVNADLEYINSDKFAKKFQNITNNEAVNRSLLDCSRAAIEHRNGTLFEDMYLINGNTGEILGSQLDMKIEQGIIYNESMNSALFKASAKDIPVVALHSHPEGYPPSVDDFNSAFEHNYSLGVVIGHNGQVYVYNNPNKLILDADNIQGDISFAYRGGADVDRAYQRAFEAYGINYEIIKE